MVIYYLIQKTTNGLFERCEALSTGGQVGRMEGHYAHYRMRLFRVLILPATGGRSVLCHLAHTPQSQGAHAFTPRPPIT